MIDSTNLYMCEVRNVVDDLGGLRIKVQIPGVDYTNNPEDWPYCFPLLPKILHVNPKVGEMVLVILQDGQAKRGDRFFIGPVISQPYNINADPYKYSAQKLLSGAKISTPLPNPDRDPENVGTLPDREDIAIEGRQNADIILKNNEIRLRCGYKKAPTSDVIKKRLHFNDKDLAYIQMKYGRNTDENGREFNSVINIVADRINLLSHDDPNSYRLGDRHSLITPEEAARIQNNAHPIAYGDSLVAYLKEFIKMFSEHTHSFIQEPPVFNEEDNSILSKDLSKMLSKTIKIS